MSKKTFADISTAAAHHRGSDEQVRQPIPALTLIAHPMPQRVGERLLLPELASGREVSLSRNAPDFTPPGSILGSPLADPFLSRKPLLLMRGVEERVQLLAGESGAQVLVGGEPLRGGREFSPGELALGIPIELADRVALLLHLAPSARDRTQEDLGMVGQSAGLQRVREDISRVADLNVPVLVRGETGAGKELVAQAIHHHSPRRRGPFVSVNLGAIPKELAAAELFGAHKGAYTGATRDREGFFRAAQGGTLFLDEVGEAPPEVQVMLLRVLETGEIYPVGGHSPVATDVRLIAATDANLEEQIRRGLFKAPLLHRLAGYEIRMPPLRERREDIGLLFHHFARQELAVIGEAERLTPTDPHVAPWLPTALASRLVRHPWPGNVRQLRNLARQLVIGSRGHPTLRAAPRLEQELDGAALPAPGHGLPAPSAPEEKSVPRRRPSDITEQELVTALREHAWDLKAAGDRLGIPRSSMYDLFEKWPHIRTAGDLSPEEITRCFQECRGDLDAMVQRLQVSKRALHRRIRELGLGPAGGT